MTPPEEYVERRGAPTVSTDEEDPWIQMNVRIRRSMKDRLDTRREKLNLSRDEWVRHVIEWALLQPPRTPVRTINGKRRR